MIREVDSELYQSSVCEHDQVLQTISPSLVRLGDYACCHAALERGWKAKQGCSTAGLPVTQGLCV